VARHRFCFLFSLFVSRPIFVQLGGILLLEARDREHAVALMFKHPGVKFGPFEIRPANEAINELFAARKKKAGA
jgi:hypothetical protein